MVDEDASSIYQRTFGIIMNRVKTSRLKCLAGCEHTLVALPGAAFYSYIGNEQYVVKVHDDSGDRLLLRLDKAGSIAQDGFHCGYVVETDWE
jgi:hypothetical protein